MKPVLFSLAHINPLVCLALFALVALLVLCWLWYLRQHGAYQRDHLLTGGVVLALVALFLAFIYRMGHFTVNAYGTMLMLGFIAGIYTGVRLGVRRHIPAERIMDLGLIVLIAAIIGARLAYILITPDAGPIIDMQEIMARGLGGLSYFGGIIGGVLVSFFYVRATKLNFWRVGDALAPGIALGYAITRIGCFLNGCCYGKDCTLPWPWSMQFPDLPHRVIPTQLLASLMGFAMFGILLWLSRGESLHRAGRLFMMFLMLEGVERIVMEIFRAPDPHFPHMQVITPAMYFCVLLIACGLLGWRLLPKQPAIPVEEPREREERQGERRKDKQRKQ
jgi:phosphatidylglycerol:prolipoprotein diacylglycerol transferase